MKVYKEKINVLSLFDGMSCGQIALSKLGIGYNYYASEMTKEEAIKAKKQLKDNTLPPALSTRSQARVLRK